MGGERTCPLLKTQCSYAPDTVIPSLHTLHALRLSSIQRNGTGSSLTHTTNEPPKTFTPDSL